MYFNCLFLALYLVETPHNIGWMTKESSVVHSMLFLSYSVWYYLLYSNVVFNLSAWHTVYLLFICSWYRGSGICVGFDCTYSYIWTLSRMEKSGTSLSISSLILWHTSLGFLKIHDRRVPSSKRRKDPMCKYFSSLWMDHNCNISLVTLSYMPKSRINVDEVYTPYTDSHQCNNLP